MSSTSKLQTECCQLVLAGRLTIERVWEAKKEVLSALMACQTVTVRLETVEAIDLSFLQMLCAARKLARDRAKDLHLEGQAQPAVDAAIARYGFTELQRCREACGSCLWL